MPISADPIGRFILNFHRRCGLSRSTFDLMSVTRSDFIFVRFFKDNYSKTTIFFRADSNQVAILAKKWLKMAEFENSL